MITYTRIVVSLLLLVVVNNSVSSFLLPSASVRRHVGTSSSTTTLISKEKQVPSSSVLSMTATIAASFNSTFGSSCSPFNNINSQTISTTSNKKSNNFPTLTEKPPRKICVMVEPTPFTHISGYANRYNEMLRYLSKAGDHVKIMTVDQYSEKHNRPKEKHGFTIDHTHGFTLPLYNHIALSLDLQMKGRQILKRFTQTHNTKPDLIHVSSPGLMVFPAMIYSRLMKIPLVMSYHTHMPLYAKKYTGILGPFLHWLSWIALKWGHAMADLTLVTSPQMKAEFQNHNIPRVELWRKGVDSTKFHPNHRDMEKTRRMMTNDNPNDFLLLNVGRIGAEKRLKEIKPILEKMGKNVRLCIVGKGPQLPHLKKFYKDTNTVFTGELTGDALSKVFATADAFVMPSDTETLGFVVMESMSSGVPVVGANAGGVPDMINSGKNGFLVETGNIDEFVDRLQYLKENPTIRKQMGEDARNYAKEWKWEDATSILRNVQYEKAVKNYNQLRGNKDRNRRRRFRFGFFGRKGKEQQEVSSLEPATAIAAV